MKVIETLGYSRMAEALFTVEERDAVRAFLAECPQSGDVIPGLFGLRKLRWTEQRRRKGKRGGTRVIYFLATARDVIVLLHAYSKGRQEDLTHADRKALRAALDAVKAALDAVEKENDQTR